MTYAPVIQTMGLSKAYGKNEAVKHLNLSIRPGNITAFLGLNGAGKSTTIKMLLGMVPPTGGDGKVLGETICDEAASIRMRQRIAYVGENKRLYDYMTVDRMIRFTRAFYPDWRTEVEQKLLRQYALPLDRKVKALSKGMRTKLGLLLAFSRRPELLILDEPNDGLDPVGIEELLENLVTQCGEGTTVFFSSHQIAEVERVADQVCMLHRGELVLDASIDDLRESYRRIELAFPSPPNAGDFWLEGVQDVRIRSRQMSVIASRNADDVVARAHDFEASSIEATTVGLREIFLEKAKEN
jgi:ABC-2 type transport system ATP-binding protein